jgi:AmmeMemoRadiSam system protein B
MIEDTGKGKLREATVAGIFYPEEPVELLERIGSLLEAARPPISDAGVIVSPHAGLDYSGDLAALAWKAAARRAPRTVLVLAPFHRAEDNLVYLPESECFDTPLGPAAVDRALVEELRDCGTIFAVNDIPHLEEHGVEIQLPFMRYLFPEARLVPVILGKPSAAMVKSLGAALSLVFGPIAGETLVVISTNLSSGPDDGEVRRLSGILLGLLADGDPKAVLESGSDPEGPVCGAGCLAAFLFSTLAEGKRALLLGHHDSSLSRQSGDERLVEYAAAAFVPAGQAGGHKP